MADFVLTIDSDDEHQVSAPQASTSKAAVNGKPQDLNGKAKRKEQKKRKRGQQEGDGDEQQDEMDKMFHFDSLAGGSSSRRPAKSWDLEEETINIFRKKNAPPRVTVDEIIARRKAQGKSANINLQQDLDTADESDEDDEDHDEALDSDESDDELRGDLTDDDESKELEKDDENRLAWAESESEHGSEGSFGAAEKTNGTGYRSAFAALAHMQEDDNDVAGHKEEGDKQDAQASAKEAYFSQAPSTGRLKVTTNEALTSSSSLPPFSALPGAALSRPILLGLAGLNLTTPTPVQAETIPVALLGKDIVGSSITGSGKTVAFWVGVLERLLYRDKKNPATRLVVICPTRELAVQVHTVGVGLAKYTDIRFALCVGGLSLKAQEAELRSRPDVLVCTPGRLIDHVRNTASVSLDNLDILVIDEADRILEEGFRDELTEIVKACPHRRQTMLFSATITEDINTLARLSLRKPVRIAIDISNSTSRNLKQEFIKIRQDQVKPAVLVHLAREVLTERCIIFFRSKQGAHRMKVIFGLVGLRADELHGNLSQEQRLTALKRFREGQVDFLLATDLASRGLDIKGITSVINFDTPKSFEIYLHRVGRTARAGRAGRAVTLISESSEDRKLVKLANKSAGQTEEVSMLSVDSDKVKALAEEITGLQEDVQAILLEEREEREIRNTEMQLQKGQNLLDHEAEIMSRPKRTWFQTTREKQAAKRIAGDEWSQKMGEAKAAKAEERKKEKERIANMNHKQKRRKEALDEIAHAKASGSPAGTASAIRAAKKAQRDNPQAAAKAAKADKKKGKKKPKGAFGADKSDKGLKDLKKSILGTPKGKGGKPSKGGKSKSGKR